MSAFPTHLLVPSTLAAEGRATRRARRRRTVFTTVIAILVVLPPILLVWLARGMGPADGTLTYPSHWSGNSVEVQDLADPGIPVLPCDRGLQEADAVVAVNGRALDSWSVVQLAELDQSSATYTVTRSGSRCDITVSLGTYPWATLIAAHLHVLLVVLVMWVVAGLVFSRKPRDPAAQALFAAAVLLPYTGMVFPFGTQVVDVVDGSWLWPLVVGDSAYLLLWGTMLHFALAFPEPVALLRRRSTLLVAYVIPLLAWLAHVGTRSLAAAASGTDQTRLDQLSYVAAMAVPASFVGPPLLAATVVWQYRHARNDAERRRVRWVVYALLATATAYLALYTIPEAVGEPPLSYDWVSVFFLGVPLVLGAAVLRYGLFDLQVLLGRSLVYGTLTFILVVIPTALGLWVTASTGAGGLTEPRTLNVALATALLVALFFQTVRRRLKRAVSRLIFGSRDDPYDVVTQLGGGLQSSRSDGSLLAAIAETVARTLRLPYVAIEVLGPDGIADLHAYGERRGPVQAVPLEYHQEEVGRLLLGSGHRIEPFGPADEKLLELLAQQVGMAAQNVVLTSRLQRSLERTVSAREEERRRLRRDIHDGLGPMLAAVRMRMEVALDLISTRPAGAAELLADLVVTQQLIIDDVRRLVDGLRPSVLDQLGLVAAIRQQAGAFSAQGDVHHLDVTVEAGPDVDRLPAAVEVAAYRIVLEALTNVARHSAASWCQIRLRGGPALELDIIDDGHGLPQPYRAGVGLSSMRERAAEVGGTCVITSNPGSGTLVAARLPIQAVPPQS